MAKIHWFVYIVVGLFISILSYRLNYEKLVFFFYVGLIFVFVGIVKLIFNLIKKKMSKKETMHHKAHHQTQHIKYCHRCGTALRAHNNFCTKCGARV